MNSRTAQSNNVPSAEEREVKGLYQQILERWNARNADDMAALFAEDGNLVGFDGSQINGRAEIAANMGEIFANHMTAAYVGIIREVRFLTPEAALLRAVSGMVPPGQSDINPAVNAVQALVAVKKAGRWQIALYQNTPAQYHGRPELVQLLTDELRKLLNSGDRVIG